MTSLNFEKLANLKLIDTSCILLECHCQMDIQFHFLCLIVLNLYKRANTINSRENRQNNLNSLKKPIWPYMISIEHLVNDTHREICGGVLVHPRYVLTRNSCMDKLDNNYDQVDANEVRSNTLNWGQYMAVSSTAELVENQRSNHKLSHRKILAMRLINFWIPYPEYRRNPANSEEINADIALAVTEYDFSINSKIQPHILQPTKQHAGQITSDFKFCSLIHWARRIVSMTDMETNLSITVTPAIVISWKSCGTSAFVDVWSHICVQLNDMSLSVLTSSGGPLICNDNIVGFMSANPHIVRNENKNTFIMVFTKVDDFHSFILSITKETDVVNVKKNTSNRIVYDILLNILILISNVFLNI